MGGSASSRHRTTQPSQSSPTSENNSSSTKCWNFRSTTNSEKMKRPRKLPRLKLNTHQMRRREDTFVWEEIPTPVYDHRETIQSEVSNSPPPPPTQERLMQIISCFPYPSPRNSPKLGAEKSQNEILQQQLQNEQERRAFCDAFGKLVQLLSTCLTLMPHRHLHHLQTSHGMLSKMASIDICSLDDPDESSDVLLDDHHHQTSNSSSRYTTLIRKRPKLADCWHSKYHEASFDLGRRLGIGRRTQSCFVDDTCPIDLDAVGFGANGVSVETMAITALPMDVWLKERLKKWVQLSGHEGSIVPATPHTLYKKQCANCGEGRAYKNIARDPALQGMTPKYYDELEKNDEHFIEIEDLLQQFADPTKAAIMDIKIGTRTFLESEVSNSKQRADLYQKMVAIDADEPTEEERKNEAITKLRYMQFRERESSTAQLGFRIEAAKRFEGSLEKNFKKVRTIEDVATTFIDFFGDQRNRVRKQLAERLKEIRKAIETSTFFATHEVVGSSILIDGYLIGIDNLLNVLDNLPAYGDHPDDQLLVTEEVVARLAKKSHS
ncbi:unnamed protein product [Caenorhabditis angaria]|uniref:Kinase n=1 Tax=Caenorhabditis angaria TaxID=860376 RepID=A0A9P1I8W6_9PELO|nr:unnamed protein product [Caenorhabditis angaria]